MTDDSKTSDPYDLVLADLEAKRAQIEAAIAAVKAIKSGGAMPGAVNLGTNLTDQPSEGPGAFLGMTIPEAAKKLLASRRQPLRNPEIAQAFKAGGVHMNSVSAANTIGSVLTRRAETVGDIVKVGRGTWGLKEWYPNRSFGKKDKAPEGGKDE